ncbi:MAG: response regulator transcription factor [Acidobacteria bacterium]|nr:response regulator transcription factor [Acidobacteriota bacterium]
MIRVLIVDDEPPARRKVRRFLQQDPEIGEIHDAGSGEEAVAAMQSLAPDLIFLDVQMPGIDGFTALAAIPEPRPFHVIFLTAHPGYALQAFEAEALDYLLKPVSPDRFERALERAKEQLALRRNTPAEPRRPLKRILVVKSGREIFLPVEKLDWAAADRNYVTLYAGPETYTIRGTLDSLATQLDPDQFVRINRSELVNLDRVREMQPWFHGERRIILKDGRELTWTRRFRP